MHGFGCSIETPKLRCLFYCFFRLLTYAVCKMFRPWCCKTRNCLDIVGHKIIVHFIWFIAFAVAVLISFYYFHWFIQFCFCLVWLSSWLLDLGSTATLNLVWNVRPCVVDSDVLQCLCWFLSFSYFCCCWKCRTHDFVTLFMYSLKRIVMNVNKARVERHNNLSMWLKWQQANKSKKKTGKTE